MGKRKKAECSVSEKAQEIVPDRIDEKEWIENLIEEVLTMVEEYYTEVKEKLSWTTQPKLLVYKCASLAKQQDQVKVVAGILEKLGIPSKPAVRFLAILGMLLNRHEELFSEEVLQILEKFRNSPR